MSNRAYVWKGGEETDKYNDIIGMPHYSLRHHQRMSMPDRAAQFSPFDALEGYSDEITETGRLTDTQIALSEEQMASLDQKLNLISDVIDDGEHPVLSVTYFVPDAMKSGGKYVTVTEGIKKVDGISRRLVLMKTSDGINETIEIGKIISISGELVDYLDDAVY